MKKQNLLVLAAAVAGLMTPMAHADTFMQFSTSSSSNLITFNGTTISGTAIPVDLVYLVPLTGGPATGTLNFSATAVSGSADSYPAGKSTIYELPVGAISFTLFDGSTNILSGTATSAYLWGSNASLMLDVEDVLGSGITFTSALYGPMTELSFQFNTGAPNSSLSITDGTLSSFDASFSPGAFVGTPAPTPEPTSLALLGTGLLGLVGVARRKFTV